MGEALPRQDDALADRRFAKEWRRLVVRLPNSGVGLSYGELKLMPWWDPLRGEPCFEKIVASLAPK